MRKLRSKIIVLLVIPLLCTQCQLFKKKVTIDVEIQRFEQDFYNADTTDFVESLTMLSESYPSFYPIFVERVLNITENYEDYVSYAPLLYEFRTHPSMLGLIDTINHYYPDVDDLNKEFQGALQQYEKYFPQEETLEVVTFASEFSNKAILYDGGIGVSLDMYLGTQYPYYKGLRLPDYIIKGLVKEQIVPSAMRVLAEDFTYELGNDASFLDVIITEGKKLYFAQKMIPKIPSYKIIEYSEEQYTWCLNNEMEIWSHLVEREMLFNRKYAQYKRYTDETPTTFGMPKESPGKVGIWVGWQIVKKYMERNSGVSLKELMAEQDNQKILDSSKYKPERK